MAIAYSIIEHECFLRSAQLAGSDQTTLEAAYTAGTLDGAEVPKSSFRTQIINIESELSHIIGSNASHPYRTYIYGASANLANLSSTPAVDANGNPFVGVFDSVMDAATQRPLTVQPTETLTDYEDAFFDDIELWNYVIVGNTLQHTRPFVNIQGCVFNRTTREAAYDANGESPLPPMLANTWIAGVMASLPQVGWTEGGGGYRAGVFEAYGQKYQEGIQLLQMGSSQSPNLPLASVNTATG